MKIRIPASVIANLRVEEPHKFLVYVSDQEPGIVRQKKGKGWRFLFGGESIKDNEEISRIKRLAIPPAWKKVWVCKLSNGHIQATGYDQRNRKQYRYHSLWNELRKQTKFHKMLEFGKFLPVLRLEMEKDLARPDLCEEKVIATVISVMERTYIRIGNKEYEKENGSYGLTTLKDRHVKINGSEVQFSFKGKKGIFHRIGLKNRRLARIIQKCRDIPGKDLFQYYDKEGQRYSVDSGKVNSYIKRITGEEFTAKDFRTWAGSLHILRAFKSIGDFINDSDRKSKINQALMMVSEQLGNTVNVCRKYYVHPEIITLYENKNLASYLEHLDAIEATDGLSGLTSEEQVLMTLLESYAIPQNSVA